MAAGGTDRHAVLRTRWSAARASPSGHDQCVWVDDTASPDADQCVPPPVDGTAFLRVSASCASNTLDCRRNEPPIASYAGPSRAGSDTSAVREAVLTCVFEAQVTWALGLDRERPIRVMRLDGPARLVIDIATSDERESTPFTSARTRGRGM